MSTATTRRRAIESGIPDPFPFMHPVLKKNYGAWAWHDRPRPGVLHHVAKSGDEIWTVRAGTQRQMDVFTIRKLCDIADKFSDGHFRFTVRSNIEFLLADKARVDPLIEELGHHGFPVGATGNSVSMISHTQGWLHCDIPGTDASGMVKGLMEMLHHEYTHEEMPNRVKITSSCCQINCGGQGDISINVQYTKPPKINHDLVSKVCERPAVVARCPVAAIRPALVDGKPSLEIDEQKCVCCGACYAPCPPMQINGLDSTKIAIWVGGKHSNARSKPAFHKLVVAELPNNPPHWPEVNEAVGRILDAYKNNARDWERIGEWIERIGWPRFFELTGFGFTKFHVDDWIGARKTMNMSAHVRF
jgi:dissimilatory sulfite reductase beta subunit